MPASGHLKSELLAAATVIGFGALAAGTVFAMRGFTVDDAWIPVRYARNWANGLGYRFNADGPISDGVTPLTYVPLLRAFAKGASPEVVLQRARALGAAAWVGAAMRFAWTVLHLRVPAPFDARAEQATRGAFVPVRRTDRWLALATVLAALPIAAHAASGMETGLALALATFAVCSMRWPRQVAIYSGLAATLRPELAAWAVTLSFASVMVHRSEDASGEGHARSLPRRLTHAILLSALALLPFAITALARLAIFGRAVPLSVLAKPSDLAHGLAYVGAASLAALAPIAAFAPRALLREQGPGAALALAAVVHLVVVAVVGGDWMPYARLMVPIIPSLALASLYASPFASSASKLARATVALGFGAYLAATAAPAGRHVGSDRHALGERARPYLATASRVASLDIGWPSSVFDGTIIDLAGLTDPSIAVLPGGHTSKRIDPSLLLDRDPDRLVFYARGSSLEDAAAVRVVEARLWRSDLVRAHYQPAVFVPLGTTGFGYVIWSKVERPLL